MDEFDDEFNYIVEAVFQNPSNEPIILKSAEIKNINNKILKPKRAVRISYLVPYGFQEYIKPFRDVNKKRCLYIGWVNDEVECEAAEYNI